MKANLIYSINSDPQQLKQDFDAKKFENDVKIMVDNLMEEVIDPEIQKINNFLIKIYLETL